ncbi:MAG: 1,4-alpha-glucan branching protein GlgB, partial [Bacillota bacterium]|nr:1,4-alpha-glucan branching protein GlgB [Bacillota bacterium]
MKRTLPLESDIQNFHEGTNYNSYDFLGCHLTSIDNVKGAVFSLWAPHAEKVNVVGSFNEWNGEKHSMNKIKESGIWSIFIPGVQGGDSYMFQVYGRDGNKVLKADPFAFYSQLRPKNASIAVNNSRYKWKDIKWMEKRKKLDVYSEPVNIYEAHLGSWKNHEEEKEDDNKKFYTYRELAEELPDYALSMGYTHIELLPVMEHPLDDSWGYQTTGYFSVTSRYGSPDDFKFFIDRCHKKGIGVILDWAPGHFCKDSHGLYNFDGTHLYENDNPLIGENFDWGTANFDFEKPEISSFLISNAVFWFKEYHIDGIRVDAVANMLYLNYGKKSDIHIKNKYGGDEKLEAIEFLKKLNEAVFKYIDNPLVIAEDSSTWPNLTSPTYLGGIGFNYKWNMGWMNDMLKYMEQDPLYRKYNHNKITFSLYYAFSENFILPLSHDEVVHGKKSLLNKMPGDYWQKFANLRVFLGYMMAHPGKKLLFMGGEFGQFIEWNFKHGLDWLLLDYPAHKKMQDYVRSLNMLYKKESSFYQLDHTYEGFEWIDHSNYEKSIISFIRKGKDKENYLIFICNFTPIVYYDYRVGVPDLISYKEIFYSDNAEFGGSGQTNEE